MTARDVQVARSVSPDVTPAEWATELLKLLGDKPTAPEVSAVVGWEATEGGNWNNTAAYNPLNTSQPEPGSANYKGGTAPGVQAYTSWAEGLTATVKTLKNGLYNNVLGALKQGKGADQLDAALENSPWDQGHYAGGFASGAGYGGSSGTSGSSSGSTLSKLLGDINPLNVAKETASGAAGAASSAVEDGVGAVASGLFNEFKPFAITMGFVGLGLVLIAGGVFKATEPARQKAKATGEQAASTAAAAGAVAA